MIKVMCAVVGHLFTDFSNWKTNI